MFTEVVVYNARSNCLLLASATSIIISTNKKINTFYSILLGVKVCNFADGAVELCHSVYRNVQLSCTLYTCSYTFIYQLDTTCRGCLTLETSSLRPGSHHWGYKAREAYYTDPIGNGERALSMQGGVL